MVEGGGSGGQATEVRLTLTARERRWLDALLILATIALAYVVIGFAAQILASFGFLPPLMMLIDPTS